ncbi:hypothetical protein D0T84_19025 [Dysgonomonas sp. 521]|uniref:tyrosine-type recombinase/integrase n=1 Tax=Dysgonomonas sp. 521 TaxID=2302932 RepID=UPI0013D0B894|nr:site-specific integrase [Dysgonomonas sp. 521]NDV96983.1 hypothetical protein [Dysgonomonas sp. 521]
MSTLTFILRLSSCGTDSPGRLCLRLVHTRRSKTISSPYKLYAQEWEILQQDQIPDDAPRKSYLEKVQEYMEHMRKAFDKTMSSFPDHFYSVEDFAVLLCPPFKARDGLSTYAEQLSRRLERHGKERTARAYRSSYRKLSEFVKGQDISLLSITAELIRAFEQDLKAKGKSLNTISFYMRNLRAICNRAVDEGMIPYTSENPFKAVFTGFKRTPKRALGTEQMQRLQHMKYATYLEKRTCPSCTQEKSLYDAWRYFIFCFQARGMCFIDLSFLRKDNIRGNIIRYYRKKTGGLIEIKITPIMQVLIDSFTQDVTKSPYLFPVITTPGKKERLQYETGLRMQNRRLKELAQQASIGLSLTTHVSRHSWASIAKRENLPLWVISEGLGHSNEKTTYTYLAQLERSRLDSANEMVCAVVNKEARMNKKMKKSII